VCIDLTEILPFSLALSDKFPFSNPLVTDNALKAYEFLIEVNKFAQRKNANK